MGGESDSRKTGSLILPPTTVLLLLLQHCCYLLVLLGSPMAMDCAGLRMELAGSGAVDRLLKRVRVNVWAHVGMSNEAVEELCAQVCGPRFQGLFAADKIPSDRLRELDEFVIIVNTATSLETMGHFVTLSKGLGQSHVEYMDSFGRPCTQEDVREFVESLGGEGEARCTVRRRVQAASSVYCGLYAVLFAAYKDRRPDFELLFSPTDLAGNDERCVLYLRRIIMGL